jgi:hypothetical protein
MRTIQTEAPYFMPVSVPFTKTLNETPTVYTNPPLALGNGEVEVLGLTTDLINPSALFSLYNNPIWSDQQVPISIRFGKPGGPKPVRWLRLPITIPRGGRLRADMVNSLAEDVGTLVFVGRIKGVAGRSLQIPDNAGMEDTIVLDSGFTGSASDDNRVQTPVSVSDDFIVVGFHTNLDKATVVVSGIDGNPWNEDPIPVWSIAAKADAELTVQQLHQPYVIPAGYRMAVRFINTGAEASGQIYVVGLRVPGQQ